jgi:DNA-binding NarL/FixJ family response regulator
MITVAIIEDEVSFCSVLTQWIKTLPDMECLGVFSSAEDGLGQIPSAILPDIVLLDINLPGISGIEAVSILKQRCPQIQVMMLTTRDDNDSIFRALAFGATGYVLKTASLRDITTDIRLLREGGSPMSPAIARKVVESFHTVLPTIHQGNITLSKREQEVLNLLTKGYRYKDISTQLFISTDTVRIHIHHIYEKLQVRSRSELLKKIQSLDHSLL